MLKKMRIYKNKIELTFDNKQNAQEIIKGLYPHEQKRIKTKGNTLSYQLEENKEFFFIIKNLFSKSLYWNKNISHKQIDGDINDPISCRLNCHIEDDGIIRITPIRNESYGLVKGKLGFGVYQYARNLHFILNRSGEFVITCNNSALDEFTHEIILNDNLESISIEIGEVQF